MDVKNSIPKIIYDGKAVWQGTHPQHQGYLIGPRETYDYVYPEFRLL